MDPTGQVVTALPRDGVAGNAILAERFESFQGEGPSCGRRCVFVRLSRCNLTCGWCDTRYTWDWSRYRPEEVSDQVPISGLVAWIAGRGVDLVVVTGGEPMLQQPAVAALVAGLGEGVRVQVETNGTRIPCPELVESVDLWVVGPKLANSGVERSRRIVPEALGSLRDTGRAVFKFVVTDHEVDFPEIECLAREHALAPVWVMPEGETPDKVLTGLAAIHGPALERGWNVSTRLHILTGAR
jgi:organic radical activating enzyme